MTLCSLSSCRSDFRMKRGAYLTTITESHGGKQLRLFSVADVKMRYRLRVPELTRQEVMSTLRHYQATGRFFMLSGELGLYFRC